MEIKVGRIHHSDDFESRDRIVKVVEDFSEKNMNTIMKLLGEKTETSPKYKTEEDNYNISIFQSLEFIKDVVRNGNYELFIAVHTITGNRKRFLDILPFGRIIVSEYLDSIFGYSHLFYKTEYSMLENIIELSTSTTMYGYEEIENIKNRIKKRALKVFSEFFKKIDDNLKNLSHLS